MKITALTTIMLLSGTLAYCDSEAPAAQGTVTVCFVTGPLSGFTIPQATNLASKMFRNIGVAVNWRFGSHRCPPDALLVTVSTSTPATLKPDAFAYALPYEGRHIEVFYDRIQMLCHGSLTDIVFAHVMVHEITHILEGVKRHSEQGVMKAKWSKNDYAQMKTEPLAFAPEDVDLIHLGLAIRHERALLAKNTAAE